MSRASGRAVGSAGLDLVMAVLRRCPLPVAVGALHHLGRAYGAWAGARGGRGVPHGLASFPGAVAERLGEPLTPHEARRLLADRLHFLLVRRLLGGAVGAPLAVAEARVTAHVEVSGLDHLERALGQGRGLIALSTHVGFPKLLRPLLSSRGLLSVAARRVADGEGQVTVGGDVWDRVGALTRMRGELRRGGICVFLADGAQGDALVLPFLAGDIAIGLGAFRLASLTRAPIVPFFGMLEPSRRFGLEFSPTIELPSRASEAAVAAAVGAFLDRYAIVARRRPSHIPTRLLGGAGEPRPDRGPVAAESRRSEGAASPDVQERLTTGR